MTKLSLSIGLSIAALLSPIAVRAQVAAPDADAIQPVDFGPKEPMTIISDGVEHNFEIEVARTREQQNRGLMFRDKIPADFGMLFAFERNEVQRIWMKNTAAPLDLLFVRKNGRILKIERNAKPYSLRSSSSEAPVAAVVELAGGRAQELGIMPGDVIKHDFFAASKASSESSEN